MFIGNFCMTLTLMQICLCAYAESTAYVQVCDVIFLHGDSLMALVGMYLADASLFISCAMSLAVFDISKVVRDGKVIEPVIDYTSGTIRSGVWLFRLGDRCSRLW